MKNVPNLLRPEEVLAVSNMLRKRLERDKEDFFRFSDCFNLDFIRQLSGNIEAAKLMADDRPIIDRLANRSSEMRMVFDKLSIHIADLHTHIFDNEPNTIAHLDLTLLMTSINQRKVDAVITLLRRLISKFDAMDNVTPVVRKYVSEVTVLFADLTYIELETMKLQREKELVVQGNQALVRNLWRMVESISNAGLLIYRRSNPNKAKEYSLSELKSSLIAASNS